MIFLSIIFALCAFPSIISHVECARNPIIKTSSGKIEGRTIQTPSGKNVDAYLGIPFAEPPTGSNRFLPPKPIKPWKNTIVADRLPLSCFQQKHKFLYAVEWCMSQSNTTEDCLYLNIWVPNPKPQKSMAVMVWIHGGGFLAGSSNLELYNGANLASEENVIVVSINYRTNIFGFLNLNAFNLNEVDGKMGILDQIEALKWIQSNINNFGGDPSRVTIFGESAGAVSVSILLSEPITKGLYTSAIVESGPPIIMHWFTTPSSVKSQAITEWITSLNCIQEEDNDLLKCLQQVKPEDVLSNIPDERSYLFIPQLDLDYVKVHKFNQVNLLIGSTSQEGSVFVPVFTGDQWSPYKEFSPSEEDKINMINNLFNNPKQIVRESIDFIYTDWYRPNNSDERAQEMVKFMSDILVNCQSNVLANMYFENGSNAYLYEFNHQRAHTQYPKWTGSEHGTEIYFVFGRPFDNTQDFTAEEVKLSKTVMRYWANFAKYGNPNGITKNRAEKWPKYTSDDKGYLEISTNSKVKFGLRDRECAFWTQLIPKLYSEC